MASIPCALMVLLICLSQDHMGVQGKTPTVFSSVGGDATLPCMNVLPPDCSSTTWLYTSSIAAVELVALGKVKSDVTTQRAKRLSLVSDCSLHITDVTTENAGLYTCRQFEREGGRQQGEDADVSLSVLQVSPVVPLVAGAVVSVSLLVAALMIIVVIYKRKTNAGEPRHKSTQSRTSAIVMQSVQPPDSSANEEEGADLHYADFQHLKPTQVGPSAKQSEDIMIYSTIMQLSGGEDQNCRKPAGRPADPNDLYATVQKNNNIQD